MRWQTPLLILAITANVALAIDSTQARAEVERLRAAQDDSDIILRATDGDTLVLRKTEKAASWV